MKYIIYPCYITQVNEGGRRVRVDVLVSTLTRGFVNLAAFNERRRLIKNSLTRAREPAIRVKP